MITYPKSYAEINGKLDLVMNSLELKKDASGLYALVPSTNDFSSAFYRVNIDESSMVSVSCQCHAASYNQDCMHRVGVDRVLEDARALLFAAKKAALLQSVVVVEPVVEVEETVTVEELPLQEQEELQASEQVEDEEEATCGRIVNGKIVNVRWSALTPQEKADAYRNYECVRSY